MPQHHRIGLQLQEQFWSGVQIVRAAVLHVAIQGPKLIAPSKIALGVKIPASQGKSEEASPWVVLMGQHGGGTLTAVQFLMERYNHVATSNGKNG